MPSLRMPDILAGGRWRSHDELHAIAAGWRTIARQRIADGDRPVALALPTTPEGVAALVALTSLPRPVMVLPTDVRSWRTEPPIPAGTPIALVPALGHLAPDAEKLGLAPLVLPEPSTRTAMEPIEPFSAAGIVLFTSGSSGAPKPVFNRMDRWLTGLRNRIGMLGLGPGAGIAMEASLAYAQGFTHLVTAMILGGPVGLLDPRDHRLALASLAEPVFHYWRATVHFVDAVSRCALTGPPVVPSLCVVSTPVSQTLFDAFRDRFGVPLRQAYSATETGTIAFDDAPPDRVQRETVGRPLPGVEVRIGEHHAQPVPVGQVGPVWVKSPAQMVGYGFPPDIERREHGDGWWPTKDLGRLRDDGYLELAGRSDDAIRTRDNRTIHLSHVASVLRDLDGVTEAVVVAVDTGSGRSFGAVVECENGLTVAAIRSKLADVLPPWSWPRAMTLVQDLPRLPNGKPNRQACIALLTETSPS